MKTVYAWLFKTFFWMYIGAVAYLLLVKHLKKEGAGCDWVQDE